MTGVSFITPRRPLADWKGFLLLSFLGWAVGVPEGAVHCQQLCMALRPHAMLCRVQPGGCSAAVCWSTLLRIYGLLVGLGQSS